MAKVAANLWRQVKDKSTTNLREGQNALNSLKLQNSDITKSMYKVTFDASDPINPAKIYYTDMDFTDTSIPVNNVTKLSTCSNDIIRKFVNMV